jgi:ComEC/Rec2-related protein
MVPFAYYIFIGTPSLILGILLQSMYACAWVFFLGVSVVAGAVAVFCWYKNYTHSFIAVLGTYALVLALLGSVCYAYQWYIFDQFHAVLPARPCVIHGTIESINPAEHLRTPYRITMSIDRIKTSDDQDCVCLPCDASIFIYAHRADMVRVGDTVTLSDIRIKKPNDADFVRYLVKEGIYATAFADVSVPLDVVRPVWSGQRFLAEHRTRLFAQIRAKITGPTFALYSALFLGNRTFDKKETEPLNTQFKRWGIAHVYARSGMHLGFIVLVWFFFMRCVPLPYRIKHLVVTFFSIVYALLSWSSISFLRSLAVFLLYQWCRIIKESYSLLYLTALVCSITLLLNPMQLFFLDFQLSYALTAALAFLYQIRSRADHH